MRKVAFIAFISLLAGNAIAADDFDARVAKATKVERSSPEGRDYLLQHFMPEMDKPTTDAMGQCLKGGAIGTTERFIVVADIQADGSFANVAVQPVNARTTCYVEKLSALKAPAPPEKFAGEGMPIVIKASQEYLGE